MEFPEQGLTAADRDMLFASIKQNISESALFQGADDEWQRLISERVDTAIAKEVDNHATEQLPFAELSDKITKKLLEGMSMEIVVYDAQMKYGPEIKTAVMEHSAFTAVPEEMRKPFMKKLNGLINKKIAELVRGGATGDLILQLGVDEIVQEFEEDMRK